MVVPSTAALPGKDALLFVNEGELHGFLPGPEYICFNSLFRMIFHLQ